MLILKSGGFRNLTLSTFLPTLRSLRATMLLFGLGKLVYGIISSLELLIERELTFP